ncbi:MAG: hypothetical protein H5U40_09285, partial [Polyangiaceae bacterium]|nr:hypothetical protein [Polyangiaceae bacterium]
MMRPRLEGWGTRTLYYVLLPVIVAAASVLGYFLWETWSRHARLGEETIVESTLLLVREKVESIEQVVITADAVFALVHLDDPEKIEAEWPELGPFVAPSVRALLVLDDSGQVIAHATNEEGAEARRFLRVFLDRIVPQMELERQPNDRLKHRRRGQTNRFKAKIPPKAINHQL